MDNGSHMMHYDACHKSLKVLSGETSVDLLSVVRMLTNTCGGYRCVRPGHLRRAKP